MGVQLPYAVELQVVRHRLHATLKGTAETFGISRNAVARIMNLICITGGHKLQCKQ